MNTGTPTFRFATVRAPDPKTADKPELEIQPSTPLAESLVTTLASSATQAEKIGVMNQTLQAYLDSSSFFRRKQDLLLAMEGPVLIGPPLDTRPEASPAKASVAAKQALYFRLYDNILVRTVTKSTKSEIFGLLTGNLKALHQQLNSYALSADQIGALRIILPEGLILAFSPPKGPPSPTIAAPDAAPLLARIQQLTAQKHQLQESKKAKVSEIVAEQNRVVQGRIDEMSAQVEQPSAATKKKSVRSKQTPDKSGTTPADTAVLEQLRSEAGHLQQTEAQLETELGELHLQTLSLLPVTERASIGSRWFDLGNLLDFGPTIVAGDSILVHSDGCYLKFPFQVADLRVVKQHTVGYLPGEIAHINNTQQNEFHERITRRLTRIETMESLTSENETTRETDSQSAEKFTVEKASSEVQSEESSINVNASVSGTYGVVTASLDAGYSSSESTQNANSASQSYAKELVQKTVDRVTSKVTQLRSSKTTQEFEETVKHVIDNTKSDGPKSYVYRWFTKLTRWLLENYGKRLMFLIDIPHPSHFYLSRSISEAPKINLPPDPRTATLSGQRILPDWIQPETYTQIADLYRTKLDSPPPKHVLVTYSTAKGGGANVENSTITIPEGYSASSVIVKRTLIWNDAKFGSLLVMVGTADTASWLIPSSPMAVVEQNSYILNNETKLLPVTISSPFSGGYAVIMEVTCTVTDEAKRAWQLKCYEALISAYENLKIEADSKLSEFDPNQPGLNPDAKQGMIMTELKKGVLSKMFRCNPFWVTDNYTVGDEYDPDCCKDTLNAEKVRFLETLFDWKNLTYELYPYHYADRRNWAALSALSDDDPRFEAFLQASYATVRVPVFRDAMKETAAVNFIMNNSIANYETVPASMKPLLAELNEVHPTKFTYAADGSKLDAPSEVVDLGIFPVPTDLVILECGTEGGVKPIGYPQKDVDPTTVEIPKQYSPAIIADRCPVTVAPNGANAGLGGDASDVDRG